MRGLNGLSTRIKRTFNTDERTFLGEAVYKILGGLLRQATPAIQAFFDVSLLICCWTQLGQVPSADRTSRHRDVRVVRQLDKRKHPHSARSLNCELVSLDDRLGTDSLA